MNPSLQILMPKNDLSDWGDISKEEKIRKIIDSWIGTTAQIIGIFLLLYAILLDRFKNPALLPAATGLIFLKTVAQIKEKE